MKPKLVKLRITSDPERLWLCAHFALRNAAHKGKVPKEAGTILKGIEIERPLNAECDAECFWDIPDKGAWVCGHQVELIE